MDDTTVEKASDTEITITKKVKATVTLSKLKEQLASIQLASDNFETACQNQRDSFQSRIAMLQEQINKAVDLGVTDTLPE